MSLLLGEGEEQTVYSPLHQCVFVYCGLSIEKPLCCVLLFLKNAFRITHSLSMRCISSAIFVSTGADCCNTMFVEYMYSLMCLISASANSTVDRIMHSDVYNISGLRRKSFSAIYTLSVYLYFSLWA